jgi:hypothetical protein
MNSHEMTCLTYLPPICTPVKISAILAILTVLAVLAVLAILAVLNRTTK